MGAPDRIYGRVQYFHSLCGRLRPAVCGEAKSLENAEKIAKDLKKDGVDITLLTPNQLLGAAAVTVATYLTTQVPSLSAYAPIVTGATLLAICMGHRKLCTQLAAFEKSYNPELDAFAKRKFGLCGSLATNDGNPCRNRVRLGGTRCWIHVCPI